MDVVVNGAAGAMGRLIVRLLAEADDCQVVAAVDRPGHPDQGKDAGLLAGTEPLAILLSADMPDKADVAIDFSSPDASCALARRCAEMGIPVVIGTTGLSKAQETDLREQIAQRIPVLLAPNMSLGVNLMFRLVQEMARALPSGYDIEIVESHHRRKNDAPSGTAMEIVRRLCAALGRDEDALVFGRQGAVGPRPPEQIAVHAIRGGDIVGEHTVMFAAEGERLELTHRASSREVFARGAIAAARYLAGKQPGWYGMADVLD